MCFLVQNASELFCHSLWTQTLPIEFGKKDRVQKLPVVVQSPLSSPAHAARVGVSVKTEADGRSQSQGLGALSEAPSVALHLVLPSHPVDITHLTHT